MKPRKKRKNREVGGSVSGAIEMMTGKTLGITEQRNIHSLKQFYHWDFKDDEDGRKIIQDWSEKRINRMHGLRKSYINFWIYSFHLSTLRSFIENFNFMVILQMIIAGLAVWLFDYLNIAFNFHISLFVSPIVFPLAFSINTDFQRREKVLDDLANFKSAALLWFFCMREWRAAAELDNEWIEGVKKKIHSIMFLLREYLLTDKIKRRDIIARYMYEDFSDISQLNENIRASKLPANTSVVSRIYHFLNNLTVSFERLRVIREYRSPRSVRSFNKVLILFLPIILCPYFVYLGRTNQVIGWGHYVLAVLVAGVFGSLQGVQDKLDNPFDGMSEDDINLDTIDEWTFNSLKTAAERNIYTVGRFQVVVEKKEPPAKQRSKSIVQLFHEELEDELSDGQKKTISAKSPMTSKKALKKSLFNRRSGKRKSAKDVNRSQTFGGADGRGRFNSATSMYEQHPFAEMLENMTGESRIERKHTVRNPLRQFSHDPTSSNPLTFEAKRKSISEHSLQSLIKDAQIPIVDRKSTGVSFVQEPELFTYEQNSLKRDFSFLNEDSPETIPMISNNKNEQPVAAPLGRFKTNKVKQNEDTKNEKLNRIERSSLLSNSDNSLEEIIVDNRFNVSSSNDNVFT